MRDFIITIEELVSQNFTVKAETREKAIEKAVDLYRQGMLVLSPGNVEMKRIGVSDNQDDWFEF